METILFTGVAILVIGLGGLLFDKLKGNSANTNSANTKESSVERKWNNDVNSYKNTIRKLPSYELNKLHTAIYNTGMSLGVPSAEMPDELTKVVIATTAIKKESTHGKLTSSQCESVNQLIEEFKKQMKFLMPALTKALENSSKEDGLGFGIITNSAVDMALYSALDQNEKNKKQKRMSISVNQNIDKEVIKLMNGIKDVLS